MRPDAPRFSRPARRPARDGPPNVRQNRSRTMPLDGVGGFVGDEVADAGELDVAGAGDELGDAHAVADRDQRVLGAVDDGRRHGQPAQAVGAGPRGDGPGLVEHGEARRRAAGDGRRHLVDQLRVGGGEAGRGDRGPAVAQERRSGTPGGGVASSEAVTAAGGGDVLRARRAGAEQHQPPDAVGPAQRQLLGDHPAHRQPDDRRRAEAEVVDDAAGVAGQVADRVRPRRVARPAAAAVVDADHPVVALERADQVARPDEARRRPAVEEHDRRAATPPSWWWSGSRRRGTRRRDAAPGRTASARMPASSDAGDGRDAGQRQHVDRPTPAAQRRRRRRGAIATPAGVRWPRGSSGAPGGSRSRQVEAPELAGRRAGQGVHERHRTRHLVRARGVRGRAP